MLISFDLRDLTILAIYIIITFIFNFINSKKLDLDLQDEEDEFETEEEHLDAMDALDLSSLKFSRHYVDLR